MEGYHKSVLLNEVIEALEIKNGSWYLDLTLGDGGHSLEIIRRGGKVVGVDVDPEGLKRVEKRFREVGIEQDKFKLVLGNFRDLENLIKQTDTAEFVGIVFDLGVSSLQLEDPQRGFSFGKIGPLDMRMDPGLAVSALDLLNVLSVKELYELFNNLGEEKYSWRLANALVGTREAGVRGQGVGFSSTTELAEFIEKVVGGKREKTHPATQVFQALRIAVNDELGALKEGLAQAKEVLEKNGRIVVISFHSLEDRIVKNTFREWGFEGMGEVLTKKPVVPTDLEVTVNPRSRSAKMRIFRKLI